MHLANVRAAKWLVTFLCFFGVKEATCALTLCPSCGDCTYALTSTGPSGTYYWYKTSHKITGCTACSAYEQYIFQAYSGTGYSDSAYNRYMWFDCSAMQWYITPAITSCGSSGIHDCTGPYPTGTTIGSANAVCPDSAQPVCSTVAPSSGSSTPSPPPSPIPSPPASSGASSGSTTPNTGSLSTTRPTGACTCDELTTFITSNGQLSNLCDETSGARRDCTNTFSNFRCTYSSGNDGVADGYTVTCSGASSSSTTPTTSTAITLCEIADPADGSVFPSGCRCTPTASGVGGTVSCTQEVPAVTVAGATLVPSISISIGTEIAPCAVPAYVKLHGSIDLPGSSTVDFQTLIQGVIAALDAGELSFVASTNTLSFEETIQVGGPAKTVAIPVFIAPVFTGTTAIIEVKLEARLPNNEPGKIGLSLDFDVCIKLMFGTRVLGDYCSTELPTCQGDQAQVLDGFGAYTAAVTACGLRIAAGQDALNCALCIMTGNANILDMLGNPPYEIVGHGNPVVMDFSEICPAPSGSGSVVGVAVGVAVGVLALLAAIGVGVYMHMRAKKAGPSTQVKMDV